MDRSFGYSQGRNSLSRAGVKSSRSSSLTQMPLSSLGHQAVRMLGVATLAFVLAGCTLNNPFAPTSASTGRPASETKASQTDPNAPKPTFSQFTDVPIPANAEMDLNKTIILGSEEGWIGRLAIDVGHSMGDMYGFYDREMTKFGWTKVTVVRSQISTLTFARSGRIATITLQPDGSKSTMVDFTVSPERQSKSD